MKNIIFTLSLLTLASANMAHSMEPSVDLSHVSYDGSQCTQGCNFLFPVKAYVQPSVQQPIQLSLDQKMIGHQVLSNLQQIEQLEHMKKQAQTSEQKQHISQLQKQLLDITQQQMTLLPGL